MSFLRQVRPAINLAAAPRLSTRAVVGRTVVESRAVTTRAAQGSEEKTANSAWIAGALGIAGAIGLATVDPTSCAPWGRKKTQAKDDSYLERMPVGHCPRPDLPFIPISEIKKHDQREKGMWVSFKGGVYDITGFFNGHPGGNDRLGMVAGNDAAIFWNVYRNHYNEDVLNFIESYRIGNLTPEDAIAMESEFDFDDAYTNDPVRHPDLLATTEKPFCGEAKLFSQDYGNNFYTPNHLAYVRLHLPVPDIAPEDWEVTVNGKGVRETTFNLKDIQEKFEHHEFACTLQCAGNRREDYNRDGHTVMISPHWRVSAFSNAKYKGVWLRDVLEYCGMDVDQHHYAEYPLDPEIRTVEYEGSDASECGVQYGVSIPIEKAVDPRGDVMLVWEMNGEPLPRDHGGPVRMLCPGYVGNKSCKFIETITVQKEESRKPWHWNAYRNFPPDITFEDDLSKWDTVDLEKGPICFKMPVQSIITEPAGISAMGGRNRDFVKVKGFSWTGNGVGMARVDVSLDGGKNWTAADFLPKPEDVKRRETENRIWSWFPFEKDIPLPEHMKADLAAGKDVEIEVVSKGVDNAFNVQPEHYDSYYNPRGCVVNNMYRVPLTLKAKWNKRRREKQTGEDRYNPPTGGTYAKTWYDHGWSHPLGNEHANVVKQGRK